MSGYDPVVDSLGRDQLGEYGDDFYSALMLAHEGLSAEESMRLNARLVLLMANQIGNPDTLSLILKAASAASKTRATDSKNEPTE
ncbi:MAG: DUF2783 domain-containing protein [Burkholderiaceae bacterium]